MAMRANSPSEGLVHSPREGGSEFVPDNIGVDSVDLFFANMVVYLNRVVPNLSSVKGKKCVLEKSDIAIPI